MSERVGSLKAFAIGGPMIGAIVLFLFGTSYFISLLLGLPSTLALNPLIRTAGGLLFFSGLALEGWTFRTRSPADVITSTYVTLTKGLKGTPRNERAGRTETLVLTGPQRYTRNPLYLGVIVMVFGWALMTGATYLFVTTLVMVLWFSMLIPFEERELRALFGEAWTRYSEETPMLFPFTKRRKHLSS